MIEITKGQTEMVVEKAKNEWKYIMRCIKDSKMHIEKMSALSMIEVTNLKPIQLPE